METTWVILVLCYGEIGLYLSTVAVGAANRSVFMRVCSGHAINTVCDIACVSNYNGNTHFSFWHTDEFGNLKKICSIQESSDGSHCASSGYFIATWNSSSATMTINALQFYDYGLWHCQDDYSKSEERLLNPSYLKTSDIFATFRVNEQQIHDYEWMNAETSRKSNVKRYPLIGLWGFDTEIQINIPCAYPRPIVKVEIQTESQSCIQIEDIWTVQFVEKCEVKGHIGSYNYTSNALRNRVLWTTCMFLMTTMQIKVFQNGLLAEERKYGRFIPTKGRKTVYAEKPIQSDGEYYLILGLFVILMLLWSLQVLEKFTESYTDFRHGYPDDIDTIDHKKIIHYRKEGHAGQSNVRLQKPIQSDWEFFVALGTFTILLLFWSLKDNDLFMELYTGSTLLKDNDVFTELCRELFDSDLFNYEAGVLKNNCKLCKGTKYCSSVCFSCAAKLSNDERLRILILKHLEENSIEKQHFSRQNGRRNEKQKSKKHGVVKSSPKNKFRKETRV